MKRFLAFATTTVTLAASLPAKAQTVYLGRASTGQSIHLEMPSIKRVSYRSVDFFYRLGGRRIYSQANCKVGGWYTFPEKGWHIPQSRATAQMIRTVCNAGYSYDQPQVREAFWVVPAPPSNVRMSPNGAIQCVVSSVRRINVYGFAAGGEWAITNACGSRGYIHNSQIELID